MTLQHPPHWTKDAAENFRVFLEGGLGTSVLVHLQSSRPALLSGSSDINAVALAAAEAAGYERCMRNLLSLAEPPSSQPGQKDAYPALEDDTQWNDGLKLTEETKTE